LIYYYYEIAETASSNVSTVGIIVVIHTNSSTSVTHSSQLQIYISLSFSSKLEKISAIYPIDFEFKYFKPSKSKITFLSSNAPMSE